MDKNTLHSTILLCTLVLLMPRSYCYENELTVHVAAGKQECFFVEAKAGNVIDVEYQVIDGAHGDLDISFELSGPDGRVLTRDYKKSDNVIRKEVTKDGDYKVCFDNQISSFNRKTIFFEIIVETEDDDAVDNVNNVRPEEVYEIQVQDILDYASRIRNHLTKARQIQDMLRSYEARDRNIAEENYFKVNTWSLFQICAMLAVGSLQVLMVRSIFDTNSKMYSLWKKLKL